MENATAPTPAPTPAPAPQPAADRKIVGAASISIPSRLAIIAEMIPEKGYVRIRRSDGKPDEVWPAARVAAMARDCVEMLQSIDKAERKGKVIAADVKKQIMELCRKASQAGLAAAHQRDTLGRHDIEGHVLDRTLTNLEWQKGLRPERGAYTEDHLPEEANIAYYSARFQFLQDYEIAAILRATDIPFQARVHALSYMNGQRMVQHSKMSQEEIAKVLVAGELPEELMRKVAAAGKAPRRRRKG